jgi:hypothetical protein
MSHLIEMSNITTRANNQFPRPDFHRLDKQPHRLQPLTKGGKKAQPSGGMSSSNVAPPRGMKNSSERGKSQPIRQTWHRWQYVLPFVENQTFLRTSSSQFLFGCRNRRRLGRFGTAFPVK